MKKNGYTAKASTQPVDYRDTGLLTAKVLLVDDEEYVCQVLRRQLSRHGFDCEMCRSSQQAMDLLPVFLPDAVVTDINMPEFTGLDLLEYIKGFDPDIEVILMTGLPDMSAAINALKNGASDYQTKPIQIDRLVQSIHNSLEKRRLRRELQKYQQHLEAMVDDRTRDLSRAMEELRESHERLTRAHGETLDRLGRASQWRDDETGFHIRRIGLSSALIGRAMGLTPDFVDMLEMASPMHDIGKIGIPDYILLKQGKLTPVEFEVMKTHTIIGAQILGGSETPMLQISARIAMTHHERWDGTGCPRGLAGKAIPLEGLIVAVADACDALRHERSYKAALEPEVCIEMLRKDRGTHFAPDVFDAFLMVADEIFSLDKQLQNESPRNSLTAFGSLGELNEMNIEQFKALIQTISAPQTPPAQPAKMRASVPDSDMPEQSK